MKKVTVVKVKKPASLFNVDEEETDQRPVATPLGKLGKMGWAKTDSANFGKYAKQAQLDSHRAPELWIADGQSKLVRFLDNDAILMFRAYRFKVGGKWVRSIKPDGHDLLASVPNARASYLFVFRVIDLGGYKNKEGKQLVNIPRFYVVGTKVYEQLKSVNDELEEDGGSLSGCNIKISRRGSSTDTTYNFMPKQGELTTEIKKAMAAFPKWEDHYQPATRAQQESILAQLGQFAESGSEDDND